MKIIMQFLLVVICIHANAQTSSLIIFSEDGDTFTLFINGERKNSEPKTKVIAADINGDGCKIKVVFQDVSMQEFSKYVMLEPGKEETFGIKKNKKGNYVLRLVSTAEKSESIHTMPSGQGNGRNQERETNTITTQTTVQSERSSNSGVAGNASINVSMSGNKGASDGNPQGTEKKGEENVSMNVSVQGEDNNASMSVSMNEGQGNGRSEEKSNNGKHNGQNKSDNTVSMNVSASENQGSVNMSVNATQKSANDQGNSNQAKSNNGNHYGQYKSKKGFCNGNGLTAQDMVKIKYDIQQKYLDAARADMVKKIVTDNCVRSSQASEMIKLLTLDRSKYDLGMFVFQHIYDPSEYHLVVNLIGDIGLKQQLEDYVLDYLRASDSNTSSASSSSSSSQGTSTTTQPASNSSAPSNGNIVININNSPVNNNTVNTSTTSETSTISTTSSGNVSSNCALSEVQYQEIVNSINSKPHSDTKMSVAKQALKNRCMTVNQVMGFAKLFVHEDDKLEFAKFAYKYTSNKSDYYKVADVFSHSFTIDELNEFLDSQ